MRKSNETKPLKLQDGSDFNTVLCRELYYMMNRMANMLKSHGVKKGDRVVIYMPVSPHAVAAMLACARIGAPHSVVFAGFSAEALATRIQDGNSYQPFSLIHNFNDQTHLKSRFCSVVSTMQLP